MQPSALAVRFWGSRALLVALFCWHETSLTAQRLGEQGLSGQNGYAAGETAADITRAIRQTGLDPQECFRVRDLKFTKDDVKLYFNDGFLIFSKPFSGRRLAAIFSAEVEGGDAEIILLPPSREERESLASFTGSPNLDEHLRASLLIATDDSVQRLYQQAHTEPGSQACAAKTPAMGASLAMQWDPVLSNVSEPMQMRLLNDLLTPDSVRKGMTFLALNGKNLSTFDVISDERLDRRVEIRQATSRDGKPVVNIWTSFLPRHLQRQTPVPAPPANYHLAKFRIDAEIPNDLTVKATTKVTVRVGPQALRAFQFELTSSMEIDSATIDGTPAEWLRDGSARRSDVNGTEDQVVVVAAGVLPANSEHEFTFVHHGNVITTRGEGVFFVSARGSWYPHLGSEFSLYDLSFRYPKRFTLVAAGEVVEDRTDGDWRFTRRRTNVPIGAGGFNLGSYEKVSGTASGVAFEVYGNRHLEEALRPRSMEMPLSEPPVRPGPRGIRTPTSQVNQPTVPDPLGRLKAVVDDLQSSIDYFSDLFGPPVLKTLTVAPIPGTFGQGFPGLVYLSTFAYLSPIERPAALRNSREQVFFSDILVPHEVAHQWWGSVVTSNRSEDRWLPEALANYSALLWLEKKKGFNPVAKVLDGYRDELLAKPNGGPARESAGPILWGGRLEASAIPEAWRVITYDKGTWVLHMLRRRLGDQAFFRMLKELRRRYEFRTVTTQEVAALVRELRPADVPASSIDTFFENWVYRTGVPALKIHYTTKGVAPAVIITGTVEQSGVEDDFSVDVPVEIQLAKGVSRTVWVRTGFEGRQFSITVPQLPLSVAIAGDQLMKR